MTKRRTKEEVAAEKRRRAQERDERELAAAGAKLRRALERGREDSAKAAESYNRQTAEMRRKADERLLSQGLEDIHYGRTHTPEARKIAAVMDKVRAKKQRAKIGADPLNLTGHTKPVKLSKESRERLRKEKNKRFIKFVTPDGRNVTVDLKSNPITGIYRSGGITSPQYAAAGDFQRDYALSEYSAMRSRGFEPGVDGGAMAQANLAAVDAQKRLSRLRDSLGWEQYTLLECVVGQGITFSEIRQSGGDKQDVLSSKLRSALDRTATFYGFQARDETRTVKALQKLLSEMAARVGEHVT